MNISRGAYNIFFFLCMCCVIITNKNAITKDANVYFRTVRLTSNKRLPKLQAGVSNEGGNPPL
jgi:hypothetical protein